MANDKKDNRKVSAYAFAQAIFKDLPLDGIMHLRYNDYGKRIRKALYVLNDKSEELRVYKSRVEKDGQYIKLWRVK